MSQVHIIANPSVSQIDEMIELLVTSFEGEIAIHAMAGGLASRKRDLFRLTLQTAVLEGAIFVYEEPESQKILSVGIAYGPGTDFLGSEKQLAVPGASEFFKNLPVETQEWWTTVNRPLSRKLIQESMGQEQLTSSWYVALLATLQTEQKKGYASLVIQEICRKAAEDETIASLFASSHSKFYQKLGFNIVGSGDRPSPFGTWTHYMLAWDPKYHQQTESV